MVLVPSGLLSVSIDPSVLFDIDLHQPPAKAGQNLALSQSVDEDAAVLHALNLIYPVRYTAMGLAVLGLMLSVFTWLGFGVGAWVGLTCLVLVMLGVTTQDPLRQQSLVVPDKATRVLNFHEQTLHALKELVQAAGLNHPQEITAHHIVRRTADHKVQSLAQLILIQLPDGALLRADLSDLPQIYQQNWPLASSDNFKLQTQ